MGRRSHHRMDSRSHHRNQGQGLLHQFHEPLQVLHMLLHQLLLQLLIIALKSFLSP
jgi:hypothetical protein